MNDLPPSPPAAPGGARVVENDGDVRANDEPRVAIVGGVRTPFAKAGTVLKDISAIELGKIAVRELLHRTGVEPADVNLLAFGTVIPSVIAPNIAREVALMPQLPKGVQAWSVARACASANQAITDAADQIALGHAEVAIAGGAESLSDVPILHSRGFSDALVAASKAKSLALTSASGAPESSNWPPGSSEIAPPPSTAERPITRPASSIVSHPVTARRPSSRAAMPCSPS